jgi:hypothetical protein
MTDCDVTVPSLWAPSSAGQFHGSRDSLLRARSYARPSVDPSSWPARALLLDRHRGTDAVAYVSSMPRRRGDDQGRADANSRRPPALRARGRRNRALAGLGPRAPRAPRRTGGHGRSPAERCGGGGGARRDTDERRGCLGRPAFAAAARWIDREFVLRAASRCASAMRSPTATMKLAGFEGKAEPGGRSRSPSMIRAHSIRGRCVSRPSSCADSRKTLAPPRERRHLLPDTPGEASSDRGDSRLHAFERGLHRREAEDTGRAVGLVLGS